MAVHNNIEEKLLTMYKKMHLGNCTECSKCKDENKGLSNPVGCWLVGNEFQQQDKRIMFVGKNARGYSDGPTGEKVFDDSRELLWNKKKWAYWDYTRAIVKKVFCVDSPEYIAFTNMIKCNNSHDIDTTTKSMKDHCIANLKILRNEIMVINPTHIIFYTGRYYDDYIGKVFDCFNEKNNTIKRVGKKDMPWREAEVKIGDTRLNVLRVGHPERMKKVDYVDAVSDWILTTS